MDRIRTLLFGPKKVTEEEYAPLANDSQYLEESTYLEEDAEAKFSWFEYSIFVLIGVAMLWAW
jgi:equilibrative nucleoside transporter 1/2/3